jgi:hypothetical protein
MNPLDGSKGIKVDAPDVGIIRDGPLDLLSLTDAAACVSRKRGGEVITEPCEREGLRRNRARLDSPSLYR